MANLFADPPEGTRADVRNLVESIKEDGLIEPLTVEPDGGRYRAVEGRRRLAALHQLVISETRVWDGTGYQPAPVFYARVPCEIV